MPSASLLYGLCGAALIGLGLYGFVAHRRLIRRVLAFNVIGSGIFLLFGASAYRDPAAGADPVPQAMIITGIVVALAATALALALIVAHARLAQSGALPEDETDEDGSEDAP
ncbi:MAG: multicomponent Na+:H+ antiporter subunit C [Saliniramus fredricksonii]|uniref:Multicomponent Na+:H+ antiporter subunit C n=1 Tax=Saliniramus fredricksonii TaxID=1653334 RepID=A0A0P7Y3Q9_9HYPH|nr:MAG: multicomponent Na+:H+ antiporter subunit C [Saliniramus fredricksonii]